MEIYFACSMSSGRGDTETYRKMISHISKHAKVLTEHFGGPIPELGEKLPDETIYKRDMGWLTKADAVIAEVTTPSLGVGYEIGMCETMRKPLLCLYRPSESKRLSAMIAGNKNSNFNVRHYADFEEAAKHIDDFFKDLELKKRQVT